MKTVTITKTVDDEALEELLTPRRAPMVERDDGDGVFGLDDGPFDHYQRVVAVDPDTLPDGRHRVTQTGEFQLAIPIWGGLFNGIVKRAIKKPPPPDKKVWWLPPDLMDRRATGALSRLCVFSMLTGYLGVLISQLNPYFQVDYGASNIDISHILIAVRIAGFSALAVVALADRRGRKTMLMISAYAAIGLAALGAFAPSLVLLGASQTLARTFSAAIALIIGIMAAEEMPSGARAFAVSMLVATGALGAGGVVVFLFVADLSLWSWRVFFLVPLVMIVPVLRVGRRLPESRRYEVYELTQEHTPIPGGDAADTTGTASDSTDDEVRPAAAGPTGTMSRSHWFRFAVLSSTTFLLNVFIAPSSGFFNAFLKTERGFSGLQISILQVITNLPGGLSMLVGGRLAETRGRRLIGAIGTAGGVGFTVLMYLSSGISLWLFSTMGTLIGAIAIPALGVYGAELFPTGSRGMAAGGLNLFGVFGAVLGLQVAGVLSDAEHFDSLGPAMAILGIGPFIVVFIILFLYPETAHRELEELNPEDAAPPHGIDRLDALDETWDVVHEAHLHHAIDPATDPATDAAGPPDDTDPGANEATGTITPRA